MNHREAVPYPKALIDSRPRLLFGSALAVSLFILVVPLVAQAILGFSYLIRGRPGAWAQYYQRALGYEYPEGIVATHLSLALLGVIVVMLVRYLHSRPTALVWSVQPGIRWRYLLLCLGAAAIVLNAVQWFGLLMFDAVSFTKPEPQWWILACIVVLTSPLQAVAEEMFFRGYLMQTTSRLLGSSWAGILCCALIFALFHGVQNPALFLNRFGFGIIAALLVWATGGLEAAIGAHVINNLSAFGYGFFTGGIAATKATTAIDWSSAGFDLAGFALYAVIAWWLGRTLQVARRAQ